MLSLFLYLRGCYYCLPYILLRKKMLSHFHSFLYLLSCYLPCGLNHSVISPESQIMLSPFYLSSLYIGSYHHILCIVDHVVILHLLWIILSFLYIRLYCHLPCHLDHVGALTFDNVVNFPVL